MLLLKGTEKIQVNLWRKLVGWRVDAILLSPSEVHELLAHPKCEHRLANLLGAIKRCRT